VGDLSGGREGIQQHTTLHTGFLAIEFRVYYDNIDDDNKPVSPTWDVGVLSGVRDFEIAGYFEVTYMLPRMGMRIFASVGILV
jgi:hypothetical protein